MHNTRKAVPWYAGKHGDALVYLLIALFFVELITGGAAFFYGIMHAAPETPGGPPIARFPWLGWAICAVLCPVGLLLLVHLAGSLLSAALNRAENGPDKGAEADAEYMPESLKRFYAMVRNAPLLVVLLGILLLGAALFFMDGAFAALHVLFQGLLPYMPWICSSVAFFLAVCFVARVIFVYRQRKMEQEYAWRREVLQKTGIVLLDKKSAAINAAAGQIVLPEESEAGDRRILDVPGQALPAGGRDDSGQGGDISADQKGA